SGLGDEPAGVRAMGWAIFWSIPITVLICVFGVRESDAPPQPHLGFRVAWAAIAENANLRRVLWPDLLTGVSQGIQGGLFLFFFQHVMQFWKEAQTLLFIYFVAGLIGAPLWVWLGRRFGKHRALQLGCVFSALIAFSIPFVPKGDFSIGATLMFVAGLPTA